MSDLVKARRLVAEIVADREEGTEDAWWYSNVSDFVLDESYGEHDGQNGADRRRILRVPAVERALIAALDLTGVEALQAEVERLRADLAVAREAMMQTAASLAAAISLLERGGKAAKKAAPSDTMFDIMLNDYRASLEKARAALARITQEAPE